MRIKEDLRWSLVLLHMFSFISGVEIKKLLPCRFPKEAERRRRWLEVAQRDEGSLRMTSCLCSRHFEPSCFTLGEEGQLTLSPDAIPTIIPVTVEDEVTQCRPHIDTSTLLVCKTQRGHKQNRL